MIPWLFRPIERAITVVAQAASCALLFFLVAMPIIDIAGRTAAALWLGQHKEFEAYAFFTLVMLTLGFAYLRDGHVRVDVLRAGFPPALKARVEVIGILLALVPLCLIEIVLGADYAWLSFRIGETTEALGGLPLQWLFKAMIPLGALMLLGAGLVIMAAEMRRMLNRRIGDGE